MPLPYRTTLRFPDDADVVKLAERAVQEWIEKRGKVRADKRYGFVSGEYFEQGVHDLGDERSLVVARADRVEDGSRRLHARFTESNPAGTWQVDAVALEYPDGGQFHKSLIVEATRTDDPDAEGEVDPPGLVKLLLSEQEIVDGQTPVTSAPRLVSAADVDVVFNAITDPNRSVSVVLAGSLEPALDEPLRRRVESLTSKLTGAASVFVLTQGATTALNQQLPRTHAVDPGHVRTYMPRVELGNPADGHNHRFLGPGNFAAAIQGEKVKPYLQAAFAIQTRSRQLSTPQPSDIRRQRRILEAALEEVTRNAHDLKVERERVATRLDLAVPQPSRNTTPAAKLRGRARLLLAKILGREIAQPTAEDFDAAEAEHDRLLSDAQQSREAVTKERARFEAEEERRESLKEDFDYQGLELVEAQDEIGRLADKVHYLEMAMLEKGLGEQAYSYVRDTTWDTPSDLGELALHLTPGVSGHQITARVVFTGDLDQVLEAQQRDGNGLVVQRAWKAARVLYDYAQLKAEGKFTGNVASYLDSEQHNGTKVPIAWHARGETAQTMDQWGNERVFPVPAEVATTGSATMEAHFKCDTSNTFATRMHYLDDTDRSGLVYVGYIGRHKTNKHTKNA